MTEPVHPDVLSEEETRRHLARVLNQDVPRDERLRARRAVQASHRKLSALLEEAERARIILRAFNHVDGEPLDDIAQIAVDVESLLRHRAQQAEARLETVERALREIAESEPGGDLRIFASVIRGIAQDALTDSGPAGVAAPSVASGAEQLSASVSGPELLPRTDLTLNDARSKLAGWHFGQESLTPESRKILYVAEGLLRLVDAGRDAQ